MPKKCPPGVLCIENITLTFILGILGIILLFVYFQNNKTNRVNRVNRTNNYNDYNEIVINENERRNNNFFPMPPPFFSSSNIPKDILMNPYQAPNRDNRVYNNLVGGDPRGMPINIPTQSVDTNYRQIGILTRVNGPETILPLMGRPLITNRDKWNFYTMNDKNNMIKLPIVSRGKSCTGEYGCNDLQNGDTVYVEGYNDIFKVTSYDNDQMRYIPYI